MKIETLHSVINKLQSIGVTASLEFPGVVYISHPKFYLACGDANEFFGCDCCNPETSETTYTYVSTIPSNSADAQAVAEFCWDSYRKAEAVSEGKRFETFKAHSSIVVPEWIKGAKDHSWGNDACAHVFFWHDEAAFQGVEVWINYEKMKDREFSPRYAVALCESETQYHYSHGETLYSGDDEQAAMRATAEGRARLGKGK